MKSTIRLTSGIAALLAVGILLEGCSELKDELPPVSSVGGVHPQGWKTQSSSNFHGTAIGDNAWDMRECRTCHGARYDGGTSKVSCLPCHSAPAGPENCATCHGSSLSPAPPRDTKGNTDRLSRGVGVHAIHVFGTSRAAAASCLDCHVVPGDVYDPGHVDTPSPAEVTFGPLVRLATGVGTAQAVTPNPVLNTDNPQALRCTNTYCHGAFKNGNPGNEVFWNTEPSMTVACGTCHGDPSRATLAERALPRTTAQGGSHTTNLNCANCHGDVVNASLSFINPTKHINGKLNVFGTERSF
ncbi:MAG: CxxxxCH/CxxCH domain-containing protein [Bacteroidota bacterium]